MSPEMRVFSPPTAYALKRSNVCFAESKHNHETALKFYAPLSVYRSAVETQVCSTSQEDFLSLCKVVLDLYIYTFVLPCIVILG